MGTAARLAKLPNADKLTYRGGMSVHEVWSHTADVCGVGAAELAAALAKANSLEVADLGAADPTAANLLPGSVARRFCVFPIRHENRSLIVATANPFDPAAPQEVTFSSGRVARFVVAPPDWITSAIESTYTADVTTAQLLERLGARGTDRRSSSRTRRRRSPTSCRSPRSRRGRW
jgi:hypothetical protein